MSARAVAGGLAFVCDERGRILRVLHDSVGLGDALAPGREFLDLVDIRSKAKTAAFLATIRDRGAAFNWELDVATNGDRPSPLHFVAASGEDGFLVIGAISRLVAARLYEELIGINNEQTNALRQAAKDLSTTRVERAERDARFYEELSRLNNELATAQRELVKKNAELARLNDEKNQFLGIAAHDLRNPLEVLLAYSHFLLEDASDRLTPQEIDFVKTIRSSSDFMVRLVNNLLDVSRIEAGRLDLDPEAIDLATLVRENVGRNRALADRKQVAIELVLEPDLPPMTVDRAKIEQVLNNLVGNAVKFSSSGSTVGVAVARDGERVKVAVRDAGPGIPADEIEKIFRPFERGNSRPPRGERGTGLGLAIVKRIVEAHGGAIDVRSRGGEGSTFTVSLPIEYKNGAATKEPHDDGIERP
jgi:signal transduction histidine kinase